MADLSCKYLGLSLKNPVIVGSSGLSSSIENLKLMEKNGAGAVVLKSVFEEQIKFEADRFLDPENTKSRSWQDAFQEIVSKKEFYFDEAYEYLTSYARDHTLDRYLKLISDAKKCLGIPVIASINCNTRYQWQFFARKIQEAGADALELNLYILPSSLERSGEENERIYFDTVNEVKKYVTIPVALKVGYYFSSVAKTLLQLSETGIAGLTLFNRPYNPDIDIDNLQISVSNMFSTESEYTHTLRWIALLSGKLKCDIAASTGIHNHETVIKQLLAGADAVQMVSVFYKQHLTHFAVLKQTIDGLGNWMDLHNFRCIADFKGILSSNKVQNPASYERVQFLRLFSGIE